MEKHHKFSMWYVLLGIWVVLIIQNAIFSAFPSKHFLQRVLKASMKTG